LVVSHRDAPLDGGLRERSLFDVGGRFHQLMGCPRDTLVLVRPDDHIAAMTPMGGISAEALYRKVVGNPRVCSTGQEIDHGS
jgi:3-(3-hydroxy-phenyl)propionate hydroxylase